MAYCFEKKGGKRGNKYRSGTRMRLIDDVCHDDDGDDDKHDDVSDDNYDDELMMMITM